MARRIVQPAALLLAWCVPAAAQQAGDVRTVVIANGTTEDFWSVEVADMEVNDQSLTSGSELSYEFLPEDEGCYLNILGWGDEGTYGDYLIDACSVDRVVLSNEMRLRDADGDEGMLERQLEALLRHGGDGFKRLVDGRSDFEGRCGPAPVSLGYMADDGSLCPRPDGTWQYLQPLNTLESHEEAVAFAREAADGLQERSQLRCGTLHRVLDRPLDVEAAFGIAMETGSEDCGGVLIILANGNAVGIAVLSPDAESRDPGAG